jgi:2-haloacid dehalogenase
MMNQKPALIFDFGGVLINWDPYNLYRRFFDGNTDAVDKFLAEIDFQAWNLEQDRGRSFAEGVAELSARFPQYTALIKAYDELWEESISGPIQSTVDTLRPFKENGYRLYGLTNWSAEKFQLVKHKYAFFELFETILVSGTVGLIKPDPRIFQLMLEQIGRPASECILIDDSAANVAAARQSGLNAVQYKSTAQMLAELAQMEIVVPIT